MTESPETPTPSLADRRSEFLRWLGRYLRKQEGWWDADEWDEVMWGEPHGTGIAGEMESGKLDAQLRQLDRIKAAAGDARAVADALIESGDIVVPTSAPAAVDLLLRLADALEADDGA